MKLSMRGKDQNYFFFFIITIFFALFDNAEKIFVFSSLNEGPAILIV